MAQCVLPKWASVVPRDIPPLTKVYHRRRDAEPLFESPE
ncbi:predicted protein [Sclerotinia sclerotiorum 1980 UF-70]|uniref:Uncharacterized protein n=1 Tax=Sclerotinia sclerotiorum (strain ATCC 18683 / 1980 / Ss-1) TaxID=665079 RepID=A7EFL2_SCLS1|nr:predicted protein [Sclerotinia sclerotiorum 1980 UF-70]EDO01628.1 predicted protein [Sclerotinia sclerotiorum 1980 UF-70]